MSVQSSFWSRSYTVIRQRVRLNLYFGEVKLSEFNQLVQHAYRTGNVNDRFTLRLGKRQSPD